MTKGWRSRLVTVFKVVQCEHGLTNTKAYKIILSWNFIPNSFNMFLLEASQCGYVVSTLASRQGDPGSNPRAARKSCEVYPGLGILQPQRNPYPTLTPLSASGPFNWWPSV